MWPAGIETPSNAILSLYQLTDWPQTTLRAMSLSPLFPTVAPLYLPDTVMPAWYHLGSISHSALLLSILVWGKMHWAAWYNGHWRHILKTPLPFPVHSYKSSFLDGSVVMAEQSAAFEKIMEASLLRNLWTVGQHQGSILKPETHYEAASCSGSITDSSPQSPSWWHWWFTQSGASPVYWSLAAPWCSGQHSFGRENR